MTDDASRGRLEIADRVIERLASYAASEVPGVRHESGNGLGGVIGRSYPHASAEVAGDRVRIQVDIAVAWPTSLPEVTAGVRDLVQDRVHELSGLQVDAVDVTAARIVHVSSSTRRVQ